MNKQEIICEAWSKNERYLMAVALMLTRNLPDAEDLYQDTAVHALHKQHLLRTTENVGGWLSLIMRRLFFSQHRKRRVRDKRRYQYVGERLRHGEPCHDPRSLERLAQREEAEQLLFPLPDKQTAVLRLLGQGYTYKGIAEQLRIPIGTVMSRLFRGRKAIAKAM